MFVYELSGCGFESRCCHPLLTLDIAAVLSKEFLDIQAHIECRFTLKRVCDMIITYSQWLFCQIFSMAAFSGFHYIWLKKIFRSKVCIILLFSFLMYICYLHLLHGPQQGDCNKKKKKIQTTVGTTRKKFAPFL